MSIDYNGPVCGCGKRGCIEALAAGPAIGSNPILRHPGPGWPAGPAGSGWPSPRWPHTAFWGHHLAEQFGGLPVDRQFGLQLSDPPPRRNQLSLVPAGDPGHLPAAGQVLPPPRIDHLRADLQVIRDLGYRPAGGYQAGHLAAELRRIASGHCDLHGGTGWLIIQQPGSGKRRAHHRLVVIPTVSPLRLSKVLVTAESSAGRSTTHSGTCGCRKPTRPGDIRESRPRRARAAGPGTDRDP